ncbi:hypothetical protein [Kitasatospora sp. NPDC058190]|uniref:hypothetical protein n=1 Tax=Kitasatospora sp. NPDC058190 TaxID=3346371 RepID=UPI0036DB1FC8
MNSPIHSDEPIRGHDNEGGPMTTQAWDWMSLQSLSMPASGIRALLDRLLGGGPEDSRAARAVLYCEVANRGQLFTAAAPCVDVIAEHLRMGGRLNSAAVSTLEVILNARDHGSTVSIDGAPVDTAAYCRARILEVLPEILRTADPADPDHFEEVCFLVPQLADSAPQVLDFLRLHTAGRDSRARELALAALEEAEDVARNGPMP